jgi:uncharacterized protein (TIGR02145 family)
MAENLKTSKYRNGSPIPNVIDNSLWGSLTTGAWANYGNNTPNNATHGKLYNWYAVADARSLCPVGWHVPSDSEWTVLSSFLETEVGFKLKSASGWGNTYNGSNYSGFTALPSGYRGKDGSFGFLRSYAYFWSSTQLHSGTAWLRNLSSSSDGINRFTNEKKQGFSVRCLRD